MLFRLLYSFLFSSLLTAYKPIDVVIPCHKKDLLTLDMAIEGIKKHGKNIRRVIVVSAQKLTDKAEWFDEAEYPFSMHSLAFEIFRNEAKAQEFIRKPKSRMGWIYQQFLKLYAPLVIPDISPNVLVLDADTVMLNDIEFIDDQGNALFATSREYTPSYFAYGARLLPGFKQQFPKMSGICHHMLFQRYILQDFFAEIEAQHGRSAVQALCRCIDKKALDYSCLSEYELYFNFAFSKNYAVKLRPVKFESFKYDPSLIESCTKQGYKFVSFHSWMRETK